MLTSSIDGELVMLAVQTGQYHNLQGVGARIWELLEAPATLDQVAETIAAEYGVPLEQCRADALAFFQQLQGAGLVEAA